MDDDKQAALDDIGYNTDLYIYNQVPMFFIYEMLARLTPYQNISQHTPSFEMWGSMFKCTA